MPFTCPHSYIRSWRRRCGSSWKWGGSCSWWAEFGPGQAGVNSSLVAGQLKGSRDSPGQPPVCTISGLSSPLFTAPGPDLSSSTDQTHTQACNQISQVRGAAVDFKTPPSAQTGLRFQVGKMSRVVPQPAIPGGQGPCFRSGGEWAQVP